MSEPTPEIPFKSSILPKLLEEEPRLRFRCHTGISCFNACLHLYRAAVCGQLPPGSLPCDELLLRFPGEANAAASAAPKDIRSHDRIAFVPGFLSDCFNRLFYPFVDVMEDLKASGFEVQNYPIGGRASSAENDQRLAKQLDELGRDPRPFIMAVYSKGLPDALELLRRYPSRTPKASQPSLVSPG